MGDFILKSTTQDMALWKQRIKTRVESGLSASEWCKTNKISKNKYYWNHKINKTQISNNEIEFIEVTSIITDVYESKSPQVKSDDFQILFDNIQVTVPSNFSEDSLARLMKFCSIYDAAYNDEAEHISRSWSNIFPKTTKWTCCINFIKIHF